MLLRCDLVLAEKPGTPFPSTARFVEPRASLPIEARGFFYVFFANSEESGLQLFLPSLCLRREQPASQHLMRLLNPLALG